MCSIHKMLCHPLPFTLHSLVTTPSATGLGTFITRQQQGDRGLLLKLSRRSLVETENILLVCVLLGPVGQISAASAGDVLLPPCTCCTGPGRGQRTQGTRRPRELHPSWAPVSLPWETGGGFCSFSLIGRTVPSPPSHHPTQAILGLIMLLGTPGTRLFWSESWLTLQGDSSCPARPRLCS